MRRLKLERATGDDEVPTEFYEAVREARLDLYAIVRRLIEEEDIPDRLVVVLFIMIYPVPQPCDRKSKLRRRDAKYLSAK